MDKDISVTLKVWRQRGPKEKDQSECLFLGNVGYLERAVGQRG